MVDSWPLEGSSWRLIAQGVDDARIAFNRACFHLEAWQVVSYTLSFVCMAIWLVGQFLNDHLSWNHLRRTVLSAVRYVPWVKSQIREELGKVRVDLEDAVHHFDKEKEFYKFLPEQGLDSAEILREAELYYRMNKLDFYCGKVSGTVFTDRNEEHRTLLANIFNLYNYSDASNPSLFPGCRKMEAEIVRMMCSLYHGGSSSCGTAASGGAECIILACLAYRNRAYSRGILNPEMVVPTTAHIAYEIAARLLKIRIRRVPVDSRQKADVGAIKRAVRNETCMLVASAPNFSSGTADDVEAIAELAQRYGIPLHVDACFGGFLFPFMELCDYPTPSFDFRVAGVTSISSDTSKYGFAPNGTSVILYRDINLLHHQYFACSDWPGGVYSTPTLAGSRNGCSIALTWATLLYYGRRGYTELVHSLIDTTYTIRSGIQKIDYLELIGDSDAATVAFTSTAFNIYGLADRMNFRGWYLKSLQKPAALHLCITLNHTKNGIAGNFLSDLNSVVEELMANPELSNETRTAGIYGMMNEVADKSLIDEISMIYLDCCYAMPQPTVYNRTISIEGRKKSMIAEMHVDHKSPE